MMVSSLKTITSIQSGTASIPAFTALQKANGCGHVMYVNSEYFSLILRDSPSSTTSKGEVIFALYAEAKISKIQSYLESTMHVTGN